MPDLKSLLQIDEATKPGGSEFNEECAALMAYLTDASRALTRARLVELGTGITGNPVPLEIAMMPRVMEQLAVCWDRAPGRWLVDPTSNERLTEDSSEHTAMVHVYSRAQVDLALRRVDRIRAALSQAVLRVYPSPAKGSCVLRLFTPDNVARDPNPSCPDVMDEDVRFALKLDGNRWEYWEKSADGWLCCWLDKDGNETEKQPLEGGPVAPYGILPAQIIYDDFSAGQPWLPIRGSRRGWVDALNSLANDLMSLVVNQAHQKEFYKSEDPSSKLPNLSGHNVTASIGKNEDYFALTPTAKLAEALAIFEANVRMMVYSESLPVRALDRTKQEVTGPAWRSENAPLLQRREQQVPLAREDERMLYKRIGAVHNYHRTVWGVPHVLDVMLELEVELADLEVPTDERTEQEVTAKNIALGAMSVIDLIQRVHRVPRHQAIRIYERVKDDAENYPPPSSPTDLVEGPKASEIARGGADSVVEAVQELN